VRRRRVDSGVAARAGSDPRRRFRRAAHLVLYWRRDGLVVHDYAAGTLTPAAPEICSTLDFCGEWRTVTAIAEYLDVASSIAAALVGELARRGLLDRDDRVESGASVRMRAFDPWNPAAGLFHDATRRVQFLSRSAAARFMKQRVEQAPMPPSVKRIRGVPRVALPRPQTAAAFPQVLLARRTWRRFGSSAISIEQLGTMLGLALGVQQWVPTDFGRLPLKTSPSGGARHPIEAYVCVRRVSRVPPGLYHYASDVHALERLRAGDLTARVRAWMPHSEYFARAAFIVIFTAVLDRELWRYPYARAYRAAVAEAGHVCQTFCLTATWQGLAPFCLMGLDDAAIEKDLGVDGVRETVLYAAGAGARPRGASWAPRPRGQLTSRMNAVFTDS
jgi:SagB-type dehydrogenase family enzyme